MSMRHEAMRNRPLIERNREETRRVVSGHLRARIVLTWLPLLVRKVVRRIVEAALFRLCAVQASISGCCAPGLQARTDALLRPCC